MIIAADMLTRSGSLTRVPEMYSIPPDVVAAAGAMLATSGLIKEAKALLTGDAGFLE